MNLQQWGPPPKAPAQSSSSTHCCRQVQKTPQAGSAQAALHTVLSSTACALVLASQPAAAHIALDQVPQPQQQQQQQQLLQLQQQQAPRLQQQPALPAPTAGFDPSAVGRLRGSIPPARSRGSRPRQQASVTATEALEALQQLRAAEQQFKQGEYAAALKGYTALVQQHPDLALTEYARLGQALCLYQEGDTGRALTELNELELDLRGNPETHAALAAVLYAERPNQRWRAEQQWDIAVEFDSRYQDAAWVQGNKHWPPRLMSALTQFLSLR